MTALCHGKIDRRGHRTFDLEKLGQLYDKYIIDPCKQFLSIDNKWVELYNSYKKLTAIGKSENNLVRFDGRFRMCEKLVGKDREKFFDGFNRERIVVCSQRHVEQGWY